MAKDIRECLLAQAGKFHQWQEITYPGKTTEEIGGAWEVDHPAWNDIFDAFCHVLTQMNAEMADSVLLDEMVYLIARANEAEGFIPVSYTHLDVYKRQLPDSAIQKEALIEKFEELRDF